MTKQKILILEDQEDVAELISFNLKEEGYIVDIYPKATNFLKKVEEFRPDPITLDIMLPDGNGFEVFQKLLNNKTTKNIPVIFNTVIDDEKESGMQLGALSYFSKPFQEKELKKTIANIF